MPSEAMTELKNRQVKVILPVEKATIKTARIEEGMSRLFEMKIEFISQDTSLNMQDVLGKDVTITVKEPEDERERKFIGTCIECEYVGLYNGMYHYVLMARPWLWFLTRTTESRIFQDMSAKDIILKVIREDYGFSDIQDKTSETYQPRVYCVQYRETDYDFIYRLMAEEGMYYFFQVNGSKLELVLCDSISAHSPVESPNGPTFEFHFREEGYGRQNEHIYYWAEGTRATTGKVTLNDYDFERTTADLKTVKAIPKGSHTHKNYEFYDYPSHIRNPQQADQFTRVRMEALAVRHLYSHGISNILMQGVGQTFKIKGHPIVEDNSEFLVVGAVHHLKIDADYDDESKKDVMYGRDMDIVENNPDIYRCDFEVIPKAEPYRAPFTVPWPEIPGLQTAIVTGPSGDEIYTDKYGRIKVQFFWDRLGQKDENTTCWVRCVMPWTGKNWGMYSIPRIGYEVAIQFEEGDPDRPICTGMLYNATNMPPYTLPDNMTQTGIVTRSTKQGSTNTFHEMVFEDKKEAEFIRLQSERDWKETIKNNAVITIGMEHQDDGDLTQTIYHTKTETIKTGDHIFTVEEGNQEVFVKTDHTCTIEGTSTTEITGDTDMTVTDGNYSQTVSSGDVSREVSSGSEDKTISTGDWTVDVTSGSISITAGTEICLTVGANSITIDNSGVTVSGTMVSVEGTATVDVGSPMTTVSADGVLTLDGGTTMIN